MAAGAALVIVGAFLPWVEITVPIRGSISRTGLDSGADGVFCVIAGVAVALVALALIVRSHPARHVMAADIATALTAVVGLAAATFAGIAANRLDNRISDVLDSLPRAVRRVVSPHVGAGLYVVGIGGVIVAAAAVLQLIVARRNRKRPPPPLIWQR